jgi:hypothetical protein
MRSRLYTGPAFFVMFDRMKFVRKSDIIGSNRSLLHADGSRRERLKRPSLLP